MPETIHLYVCAEVTDAMTCRFNGACYGEICISPTICLKKESDLTDEEKASIAKSNEAEREW